ncbi:MAG: response regulator [Acidobacteriia bacterium]|nr:response regulator [Terriglobia bacterium]
MNVTVLLIDYDPCSICRIRGLLSSLGIQPIVARDGVAGIAAFKRYLPDLTLIQDLVPRKHGFEVCKELKATEDGRRSAILLLADVRNGRRYAALATGCDDFVSKPINGRILVAKIRKLLPRAGWPDVDAPVRRPRRRSRRRIVVVP